MRIIIYQNEVINGETVKSEMAIVCDWAKRMDNRIVFGTRTKEIVYAEYRNKEIAVRCMQTLIQEDKLYVSEIHQMPYASLDSVLDLVSGRTTW